MDFTLFTIPGILNMFKHGLLRPAEIIKAEFAISVKIICEGVVVNEEDQAVYDQFTEVARRAREMQQFTHFNRPQQVVNDFEFSLLPNEVNHQSASVHVQRQPVAGNFRNNSILRQIPTYSDRFQQPINLLSSGVNHQPASVHAQRQPGAGNFGNKSIVRQIPTYSDRSQHPINLLSSGVNFQPISLHYQRQPAAADFRYNSVASQIPTYSDRSQECINNFDLALFDGPSSKEIYNQQLPAIQPSASTSRTAASQFGAGQFPVPKGDNQSRSSIIQQPLPSTPRSARNPSIIQPRPSTSRSIKNEVTRPPVAREDLNQHPNFKYFTLESESLREIKKFSTVGRSLNFKFKPVTGTNNPMEWLKAAFEELRQYVLRDSQVSDFVGLVLRNYNYPEKPMAISFRRVDQLSTDVILSVIEKVLQSNANFFAQEAMSLQLDKVSLPVGRGRASMTGVSFEDYCQRKNGILVVHSEYNLCLAAAIVLAIAFKTQDPNFKLMKIGLPILNQRATELCTVSNVDLTNGGSYEHIQSFQNYLTNYTIVVYNCRFGKTTYFEGPREQNRIVINLILEDDHFNVITSLTSVFTASYYCELCKTRFNNKAQHRRCLYSCPACHTMPPCAYMFKTENCKVCNRDFRGLECLENHKRSGLCQKLIRCDRCLYTVWVDSKNKHICGYKFCDVCSKFQPIRHYCYMTKNVKKTRVNAKFSTPLFVFYDFECRQEKPVSGKVNNFFHEPNLCVAAHICMNCIENEDVNTNCDTCGQRLNIFSENPVQSFLKYISKLGDKFKVTALAHNMRGYDGCFVLQELIKNKDKWSPKLISTGTKIISITCGRIKFIDSLNFIPLPLSKLPKTFDFPESKGYFPYLFNTLENQNHIGRLPEQHFYSPDQMNTEDRANFLKWYSDQIESRVVFDMNREILKYCIMDVQILLKACLRFWRMFTSENFVDPFQEAATIASACNLVFRRRFLKDNSIGLIPRGGYRMADKQSTIAIKWLLWEEHKLGISIQHGGTSREFRIPKGILVDGYCAENKTVYEFLGCYWHGCEFCFPNQISDFQDNKNNALFLRREQTEARTKRIKDNGYQLVQMRECYFQNLLKRNEEIRDFIANHVVLKHEPLDPRQGFFGGRTNAVKLYYKCQNEDEKIYFFDIVSLYPFINKYSKYPVGHPKIHVGHDVCSHLPIDTIEGLIKCSVLPPSDLYHPVLPCRLHNKLMFILCRTCGETLNQGVCNHNEEERSFVGTYVADELRKALSLKYKVLEIHEIWEYQVEQYDKISKTGGLFSGYVDNFLKMKQECSGWPTSCVTDLDKANYIVEYLRKEGIHLTKENIRKNPGMRYLAKLMLNSFWGKFGQRENLMQSSIISNPEEFFKLLTDPSVEVHSIIPIDDEVLIVNWDRPDESIKPLATVNVAIAAYTTAHARLELYKYLEKLNKRVLYFDTDSVIFVYNPGDWKPETGDFLGKMTDEIEQYGVGSYISEFISGGPKNYSYSVYSTDKKCNITICKVKGITLNFQNSQIINFESMKEMVCGDNAGTPLHVNNDRKIARTSAYDVISKPERKIYKITYNKRRRLPDSYDTLPYGFIEM